MRFKKLERNIWSSPHIADLFNKCYNSQKYKLIEYVNKLFLIWIF